MRIFYPLIAISLLASPAFAGDTGYVTKREPVSYHDLDLSKASDREVLNERIERKANRLCSRSSDHIRQLGDWHQRRTCIALAKQQAYAEIRGGSHYAGVNDTDTDQVTAAK